MKTREFLLFAAVLCLLLVITMFIDTVTRRIESDLHILKQVILYRNRIPVVHVDKVKADCPKGTLVYDEPSRTFYLCEGEGKVREVK